MADLLNLLLGVLDDLLSAELKRFRFYLTAGQLEGFSRIPRGHLESDDPTDIASKMRETYGNDNSLKIAQLILRKINRSDLADRLRRAMTATTENQERHPLGAETSISEVLDDDTLGSVLKAYRARMKRRFECIFEGLEEKENKTLLSRVYTEMYLTEEEIQGTNTVHEVTLVERAHERPRVQEQTISCNDIFRSQPGQGVRIRTVLTKGIAGIGKTVAVQKFILDWTEGVSHQDVDFMFVLPFRGLNLVKDSRYSLHGLLQYFHPELQGLEDPAIYANSRLVFIFDGLDESRLPLNFDTNKALSDISKKTSVDSLITNLIQENLLPSALIWITTRPAAAKQVPPTYVQKWTEVRGFNEKQQEEYFNKKIKDQSQKVLSHIRKSRSLQALCHIPVFCWILATVLPRMLVLGQPQDIPITLTEVFISFLVIQMSMKAQKYQGSHETDRQKLLEDNKDMILRLARLAFQGLNTGTLQFYEKDLKECGMDESDASLYAGVCTEVFVEESALFKKKVYCFVHLSIQEFFAALHVLHVFVNGNLLQDESFSSTDWTDLKKELSQEYKLNTLLKNMIDMSLRNENGQLDLVLRFLLGMSLESNQKLLQGILPRLVSSTEAGERHKQNWHGILSPAEHIKDVLGYPEAGPTIERSMHLLRCLQELKDSSLQSEVQEFLKAEKRREGELSLAHCTALADMLLVGEDTLEELDLKKFNTTFKGYRRLIPAVKSCRKAQLSGCGLFEDSVQIVSSVLKSVDSQLCELDMSNNPLFDDGIKLLCGGLGDPHCRLVKLRLSSCGFTSEECETLVSALQTGESHLRELDLSHNGLGDHGVALLLGKLLKAPWKLHTLSLAGCGMTRKSCETVSTVLKSAGADLRDLNLGSNALKDEGVTLLSSGLLHSNCKLKILRLAECDLAEASCKTLASVLLSTTSPLRQLELHGNKLKDSGVQHLAEALKNPRCQLERLDLSACLITEKGCDHLALSLRSNPLHLRELDLKHNNPGHAGDTFLSIQKSCPQCALKKISIRCPALHGVRTYACNLTLDPNTATECLFLCEGNRTVQNLGRSWAPYPDHPERFFAAYCCAQVLCHQALTGRHYWEVTHSPSPLLIGVAYKSIPRTHCPVRVLGRNDKSWSLFCGEDHYIAKHNREKTNVSAQTSPSRRIGVYLDWPGGQLSFYSVASDTLTHLHTYHARFTEPLYAGFCVYYTDSTLTICHIK